eukprot:CAMPEP_0181340792 /NCGR_PEP_ID=MMETSP1101-20121128/30043_1 /TAXON_ID=46948 /ORGANISM="Rhodomonas abbreviata, Strain Caron Lab Isolate" /LENGTH=43 /DNA_ID= /DNA_START= /DNA_END= /DNA_ORIENTATION=
MACSQVLAVLLLPVSPQPDQRCGGALREDSLAMLRQGGEREAK